MHSQPSSSLTRRVLISIAFRQMAAILNRRSKQSGFWLIVLAAMLMQSASSRFAHAQTSPTFTAPQRSAAHSSSRPSTNRPPSGQRPQTPKSRFTDARPITRTGSEANTTTDGKRRAAVSGPSAWKTFGVLAGIIAVILFGSRLWKKHGPRLSSSIPTEAIDILGKRNVDSRQSIYLIRLGSRIIVVGSTANGLQTLSEVTDPVEVDYLAGLCKQQAEESNVAQSFRSLFSGQNVLNSAGEPNTPTASEPETDIRPRNPQFAPRAFAPPGRSDG